MSIHHNNYEPVNDLFKFLLLSVLLMVSGFLYIIIKATNGGMMQWCDWLMLSVIGFVAGYFLFQTYRYRV